MRVPRCVRVGATGLSTLLGTTGLRAETAPPGTVDASASVAVVLGGLVVVLGLLVGSLWLLKRLGAGGTLGGFLQVIGGCAVGPRERVVAVEAGDTVLLLGVAPGRVNLLHTLPRKAVPAATGERPAPAAAFSGLLAKAMGRERGDA